MPASRDVPGEWEGLRDLFAELLIVDGLASAVPQRYGGTAEELFCFPEIGRVIRAMGEVRFVAKLEIIWADNMAGRRRVVAKARSYFDRMTAGDKLTEAEAKAEWKAVRGANPTRGKEHPESAVVYGLAMMLAAD